MLPAVPVPVGGGQDVEEDTGLSAALESLSVANVNEGLCSLEENLAAPKGLLLEGAVDMTQDEVPSDLNRGHSASSVELLEDEEDDREAGLPLDGCARRAMELLHRRLGSQPGWKLAPLAQQLSLIHI